MVSSPALRRNLALIVVAAMTWGTTGLTSTVLDRLSAVDALSVGFLRLATASPALLLMAHVLAPGTLRPILRSRWRAVAILGMSMASYNAFFFAGIARATVMAATLLAICSAPLFVALLARIFLHEALTRPVLLALAAGVIGTILLVIGQASGGSSAREGLFRLSSENLIGYVLAVAAGLAYATYAVVGRAMSGDAPPASLAALSFTLAAVLLAPVALAHSLRLPTNFPAWLAVLYLGLVPTALAYPLYFIGLRAVPATIASIATLVEPLTATLLAALFLGERLTPTGLIGAVLLLGSLAILSIGKIPGPQQPPRVKPLAE